MPTLNNYYKTSHYVPQVGTHSFEGIRLLCPPLPGKAMKRSFSKWKWKLLSCVQLLVTPWTVACQAPLSMEFPRQEYWHGEPFPSPGDLPNAGIESRSPSLQADFLPSEPPVGPLLLHPKLCLWDLIWHWVQRNWAFSITLRPIVFFHWCLLLVKLSTKYSSLCLQVSISFSRLLCHIK